MANRTAGRPQWQPIYLHRLFSVNIMNDRRTGTAEPVKSLRMGNPKKIAIYIQFAKFVIPFRFLLLLLLLISGALLPRNVVVTSSTLSWATSIYLFSVAAAAAIDGSDKRQFLYLLHASRSRNQAHIREMSRISHISSIPIDVTHGDSFKVLLRLIARVRSKKILIWTTRGNCPCPIR